MKSPANHRVNHTELIHHLEASLDRALVAIERAWIDLHFPDGAYAEHLALITAKLIPPVSLNHTAAAIRLTALLGRALTPEEYQRVRAWFPRGVPEGILQATAEKLQRPQPKLTLVTRAQDARRD